MKSFEHILDTVDDYLHGLLTPSEARHLEEHCQKCRICETALEEARQRRAAMQSLPPIEAGEGLIQSTLSALEKHQEIERKRRQTWQKIFWGAGTAVAAAILILIGFHVHYANLAPSPYDLTVLGQDHLLASAKASLRVRLVNRKQAVPVAQVPVQITLGNPGQEHFVSLAEFTTDGLGTGTPRFQLPDWPDGDYELRIIAQTPGGLEVLSQKVHLQRSWKLMLSSDKPVYQPAQTIHVRALALRQPTLKPVAGQQALFAISDPKGNVIFKRTGVTSDYGISFVDCPLADELIEGLYTITCKIGDSESKRTVEVKRYVLPKFKIELAGLEPYYRPGQRVKGTVQVNYFFGQPVANAEVALMVRSSAPGADAPGSPRQLRTDTAGRAAFDFVLAERMIGRPQDGGDARFFLDVAVVDSAGQKQSRSLSRIVTSQDLKIEVIPEAGALVQNLANTIHVFVSYPDGQPAANARLAISGLGKEIVTSQLGVASFEYTPRTDQPVSLTFQTTDEKGRSAQRTVELQVGNVNQDFLARTDKATYKGGDTMHLTALGDGVEPIFIDLIKDGQTMLTEVIDMASRGRQPPEGTYQFTIPPDIFGTVELVAYRFGQDGVPVRKSRVLYIRPAGQLTIHATTDRKEYRPGEQAKLLFRITDPEGKPVPGALSLAVVDEAVFSVLDQAPGMEKVFYLLEQKLLEPVYAIYPWAPDLTTSLPPDERNRFEQALFARTANGTPAENRKQQDTRAASPHSLTLSGFSINSQSTEQARQAGNSGVRKGWGVLAGTILLASYIGLWFAIRPIKMFAAHGVLLAFACLLSPIWLVGHSPQAKLMMFDDAMMMQVARKEAASNQMKLNIALSTSSYEPAPPAPPRVREWFPETLLWLPQLITDNQGHATLPLDLADSITTWRLTASAISADGRLGATQQPVLVFQPFFVDVNLPVSLTRNDEVAVPVVVHNHLDRPQSVSLKLANAGWFDLLDDADKSIELGPHQVKAVHYRIKARKVGQYPLEVTALASGVSDAIKKEIDIVPDGRRVEQVWSGSLDRPFSQSVTVPADAVEGSPRLFVKLYPSTFSQLVEGLDAIFQMPYGCFEQTSSTTYPNILALDYLRRTKKSVPEVEAKARQYIHIGYQRLVSFEVSGGGFDWFGRPPANVRLTAYGLMEFRDMARVHDVDPNLVTRTRQWLLAQRRPDGSWPDAGGLHQESNPARGQQGSLADYAMTAYVAWAVFASERDDGQSFRTKAYLLSRKPDQIADPYVLALTCNALLAMGASAEPYLDRLESLKRSNGDGKSAWWELGDGRTAFYGSGQSGNVEATALAALAFVEAKRHPATTRAALSWITQQKDPRGTWHSTQATVLALKALLAGTGASLGEETERRIEIALGDLKRIITIPKDQADVVQQVDLSTSLVGAQDLQIRETTQAGTAYQVVFRHHVPEAKPQAADGPLAIDLSYDRSELAVNDRLNVTARVGNRTDREAPMVILDLPIPAGFAVDGDDFRKLVEEQKIAKFQLTARQVIVYLRGLQPGQELALRYGLRATMPVKVQAPAARAYEYYNPARQGIGAPAQLVVE